MQHPSPKPTGGAKALQHLVGRNVGHFRGLSGLTQGDLAAAAGLSISYVSRIESGCANVRATTLQALAAALGVEAAALLQEAPFNPAS